MLKFAALALAVTLGAPAYAQDEPAAVSGKPTTEEAADFVEDSPTGNPAKPAADEEAEQPAATTGGGKVPSGEQPGA